MTDTPNWSVCRYADLCNEEGACSSGCELRRADGACMRHAPNPNCECHDCIRAQQLKGITSRKGADTGRHGSDERESGASA